MNALHRQALRLFLRELRSGELRTLILSLTIAIAATSAIGLFTDRLERAMLKQAGNFLGADLVLRTARPFDQPLDQRARDSGLEYSEVVQFPSMLVTESAMILSSVKVVDDAYPLRGGLKTRRAPDAPSVFERTRPAPGEVWVAPSILAALNAQLGDPVELGAAKLRITRLLDAEPEQGVGLFSLRPRALINRSDLAATEVLQPGSRVRYRYLFAGSDTALDQLKQALADQLLPGQRLLDIRDENPTLGSTLTRAEKYLRLSSLLAVVLAGVAIAMAARRYCERHFDAAALMRCLGAQQGAILRLFVYQLLLAGGLASLLGLLVGGVAQFGLIALLAPLLPDSLPLPGLRPLWASLATGLVVLAGFALPPLLRLRRVSPLRVLRRELTPLPLSAWLVYGSSMLLVGALFWAYSADWRLTLVLLGGGLAAVLLLALVAAGLLQLAATWRPSLAWRLAVTPMLRRRQITLSQMIAFGLTLGAMSLLLLVRGDLLSNWQQQLPEQAPNHFLINIQPDQVADLQSFFEKQQIPHQGLFPMVRGRLATLNGAPANQVLAEDSPGRRALRRELNLTWSGQLAPDNRILAGRWWQPEDHGQPQISLEQGLAHDLGVSVGDQLGFHFGDRQLEARVASVRSLEWSSLRPNFYVIFPPGSLDGLPASYITSFYLPANDSGTLQALLKQFPTLTLLEMEPLLEQIRGIVEQVTLAVEYVLLFVLLAGLTVLYAALGASLDERLFDGALLRTLGASRTLLRRAQWLEFTLLGALSGVLAACTAELVAYWLYTQVLQLEYEPKLWLWLINPLAGALLIGVAGRWGTRPILRDSPLRVWREIG